MLDFRFSESVEHNNDQVERYFRCEHLPFHVDNGGFLHGIELFPAERIEKEFPRCSGAGFHFDEMKAAVPDGNDIDFGMSRAPVPFQDGEPMPQEVCTSRLFAFFPKVDMICHSGSSSN